MAVSNFFLGRPEQWMQRSNLSPGQMGLQDQLQQAAGGGFGDVANYYRNLLSNNPADLQAMAAPEMRRFQEDIIPGLAEQFAGMGSGNLQSSGFRNAGIRAGTDLSERIAAMRANLRQQGAQGLQSLSSQALSPYMQNILRPRQPGFLEQISPIVGSAIGAFGGPALGAFGGNLANRWFGSNTPASALPPQAGG